MITHNTLITNWLNNGKELSPHLKASLEKLSSEHVSGIALSQLDSPMMKQYRAAKEEVPDAILFFRMGDFYELFGTDAVIVSDLCGLTLTSRDKSSHNPVPMAGTPVSGYKNYLKKCVLAGFKVAICEQMEDPRQAKGIVKREITRIATPAVPGDLDDDDINKEQTFGCYLACVLSYKRSLFTLSYIDVSTGEFRITTNLDDAALAQEIATIHPKEIITASTTENLLRDLLKKLGINTAVNKIESWILRSENNCKELFCEFFSEQNIHTFGLPFIPLGLEAVTSILFYLKSTQKSILKNIQYIKQYEVNNHLIIDDSTKKHLDFFHTSSGEKKGSLFHFLNRCATAVGSRALVRRLNYPFKHKKEVEDCHNSIETLIKNSSVLYEINETLKQTADLERLLSRAAQKLLDPRGMVWMRKTLELLPRLEELFSQVSLPLSSRGEPNDETAGSSLSTSMKPLYDLLNKAFVEEPMNQIGKGGQIFNPGFHSELDEIIELELNFNTKLEQLEKFERERSQIPNLKIGFTRVFGYYFEISKGKLSQVPAHFMRKQTLTNGERFITTELKELEEKALNAADRRIILEKELLESIRNSVLNSSKELLDCSHFIGKLDLLCNFSLLAIQYNWIKPEIIENNATLLKNSTHPILAYYKQEDFVANDITLGDLDSLKDFNPMVHLITGPNMSGKSTLMRQVALAQVLCQIGCYVAASEAKIGLTDRILTRIGSADHALKNQSTFMVEMLETSNLLRLATEKSLLILDEIGRGTSTYDGVSLAWSILEYLHDKTKARTLFSTHYHELADVCVTRKNIVPMQLAVMENHSINELGEETHEILFSRKYSPGSAGKSYGILVAKLAGIPLEIIERAEVILKGLEEIKQETCETIERKKSKKMRTVELPEQTLF